jgi:predicted nuclease of predicted toxin-antitoxin system
MLPPILLDQGLPWRVAASLRELGIDALAVGDPGAPPEGSDDETNIRFCKDEGRVLVTNDRGRKDKQILVHLQANRVHAVFVYKDLREAEPYALARALLDAAEAMADRVGRSRGLLSDRLKPTGRLEPRRRR